VARTRSKLTRDLDELIRRVSPARKFRLRTYLLRLRLRARATRMLPGRRSPRSIL
jgi:hypothetical protein